VSDSPSPSPSAPDSHALVQETLEQINLTVMAAGGTWTLGDDTPWRWPMSTVGYWPNPCTDDSNQYGFDLSDHSPRSDPIGDIEKVRAAWQAKGWKVRTIAERTTGSDPGGEITVNFRNDGVISFDAAHSGAGIVAQTACSTDPSTNEHSK